MHDIRTMGAGRRAVAGLAVRAAVAAGCALFLCGCNTDQKVTGMPDPPSTTRDRRMASARTWSLLGSSRSF